MTSIIPLELLDGSVLPREILERMSKIPRVQLAITPTPLQECPRLAKDLGIGRLYVKRDDLTGLAFGGNKVRNLEFRLAEAVAQGADTVVVALESQSNSARQVTAGANILGLKTILVLRKDRDWDWQGNLLVDRILGAEVRFESWDDQEDMKRVLRAVAQEQEQLGAKPYSMNLAESFARGSALAYLLCTLEIVSQSAAIGVSPTHLYMASGNKGYAGLVLGKKLLGAAFHPIAISQRYGDDLIPGAIQGARDAAAALGWDVGIEADEIHISTDYVGPSYGIPTEEGMAAIKWAAHHEGLLLDPIYTGKAMAGLVDHAHRGRLNPESVVVFIHTGGLPALFAYKNEIIDSLG